MIHVVVTLMPGTFTLNGLPMGTDRYETVDENGAHLGRWETVESAVARGKRAVTAGSKGALVLDRVDGVALCVVHP